MFRINAFEKKIGVKNDLLLVHHPKYVYGVILFTP